MKTNPDHNAGAADDTANSTTEEANVQVETIGNRIKVGRAICSGVVPFGITATEAKQLQELGLVRIIGLMPS